ncbi:hypothetical protein Prudu_006660 [Prunus dulcis]|uniref:Uncharacterized protein n=1 Tax=Prunus dulcis TaxID=3755 RepID=A0A4Y1R085_PRUDU|nr:hypothetical protein Prudu_006660 [Prunus dulcis]
MTQLDCHRSYLGLQSIKTFGLLKLQEIWANPKPCIFQCTYSSKIRPIQLNSFSEHPNAALSPSAESALQRSSVSREREESIDDRAWEEVNMHTEMGPTETSGPRPKHWKRNTAIAMAGIFLVCIPIAMKSAELDCFFSPWFVGVMRSTVDYIQDDPGLRQRPHNPVRPIPSQLWCKNFGNKDY